MSQHERLLHAVSAQAKTLLRPLVGQIDGEGFYPRDYLKQLGAIGGFSAIAQQQGLFTQIDILRRVGEQCGATAFSAWCQAACAWYLRQSPQRAVREKYGEQVFSGQRLAGTAMSNTIKHLAGIEGHKLKAIKNQNGYIVNGSLPWVSNIGVEHVWAAAAQTDDGLVMFMLEGWRDGVQLKNCPSFCALEGTATLSMRLKDVQIEANDILADTHQFDDFIRAIKPGFILLQSGIGAGVIEGCLKIMRESNAGAHHMNRFLDDSLELIEADYVRLLSQVKRLAYWADAPNEMGKMDVLPVLQCRLDASRLALRAAQSAALHAGAKGYLLNHAAQRRSREAMFVAIVTPAIKHLQKEIAAHQQALAVA